MRAIFFPVALLFSCISNAQTNESYIKFGVAVTEFNTQLVRSNNPGLQTKSFWEPATSFYLSYYRRVSEKSLVGLTARYSNIATYTEFNYQDNGRPQTAYSGTSYGAYDYQVFYKYDLLNKRFQIQPKIGFALFYQSYKKDTTQFNFIQDGNSYADGYYDNALKIGFLAGADINLKVTRHFYVGLDMMYVSPFNNDYAYYSRVARYNGQTNTFDQDATWGVKLSKLYVGFNLVFRLGYVPKPMREDNDQTQMQRPPRHKRRHLFQYNPF